MSEVTLVKAAGYAVILIGDFKSLPSDDGSWRRVRSLIDKAGTVIDSLDGRYRELYSASTIGLRTPFDGLQPTFDLDSPIELPGLLFSKGGAPSLRTWRDLESDKSKIAEVLQKHLSTCLNEARAELRRRLTRQTLKIGSNTQFLDLGGLATSGTVALTAAIDPALLLGEGQASTADEIASFELTIGAKVTAASQTQDAAISLRLSLNASQPDLSDAALSLLPSFDFPKLPSLPRPRFRFPKLRLKSLVLAGETFPGALAEFLVFDLHWPVAGSALPLKVEWTSSAPQLGFTGTGLALTVGPSSGELKAGDKSVATLNDIKFTFNPAKNPAVRVDGTLNTKVGVQQPLSLPNFDLGGTLPLWLDIDATIHAGLNGSVDLSDLASTATATATLEIHRLVIRAKDDPRIALTLSGTFDAAQGRLTRLEVIDPYPLPLITSAGSQDIPGTLALSAQLALAGAPTSQEARHALAIVERIGQLLDAALRQAAGPLDGPLATMADSGLEMIGRLLEWLAAAKTGVLTHIDIDVRLDAASYRLRQLRLSPRLNEPVPLGGPRLSLDIPVNCEPELLIDLSGPFFAALSLRPPKSGNDSGPKTDTLMLGTDLWLDGDGQPAQSMAEVDPQSGSRPNTRLIQLDIAAAEGQAPKLALAALDGGQVRFFQVMADTSSRPILRDLHEGEIRVDLKVDEKRAKGLLPIFGAPKAGAPQDTTAPAAATEASPAGANSFLDRLDQYVQVEGWGQATQTGSTVTAPLTVSVHVGSFATKAELKLALDLSTLAASMSGGSSFVITGDVADEKNSGSMFGLDYRIAPRDAGKVKDGRFNQFQLDLSQGNPRMALHPDAKLQLYYRKLGGRGLAFIVDDFAISRSGFDLSARVNPDEPVTLPGVEMPFRFVDGTLSIRNGSITSFSITGAGQLPPELVGEASCKVKLMLGPSADGDLAVLACDAELDKSDDPIVCKGTRFTLTISKLGFELKDFGREGGYQFYFLVTGSIVFSPPGDEFGSSFLRYLRGARVSLTKAPLARDVSLLAKAINIQIPLDPKVTFNLFEVFGFEVRGFGFHPSSEAFGGSPAMSISGQVNFRNIGDVINAKIDCHSLWIAPPAQNKPWPRVRFDGLAVAISLNGAGTIEGTALTVDENLPALERPFELPAGITASGFLASGRLHLSGWAPMTASMGFLELAPPGAPKRHAFYLYGQAEKLSVQIPTPVKELYLREVGFGFGYRYTLAGLARTDKVTGTNQLIEVLDDVSRRQGDLAKFSAWQPEFEGDRITLAMRAMLSVNSAYMSSDEMRAEERQSGKDKGKPAQREQSLANPLLFDVAAALRSDLTFLLTARAWISLNYYTWLNSDKRDTIASSPPLRGYMYISAPRKELLARLVSDPEGHIGETPKLPDELVQAFKNTRFSSMLYIRPGLFHFEFGWPYELELKLPFKPSETFGLVAQGGMVTRIEDASLLYGVAFRATGFAQFGGQVGGKSLGASVKARADFSLDAKLISYVSLTRPGDSLFYGSLAFACTVNFEVCIWLEIDLMFDTLRLDASFCASFSLSVALEAAIGPNVFAGRAAVSISVGAFGRSLTLSAGFGINEGALDGVRARVSRFLALGLTAAVPDPESGLAPPPLAPPRAAGVPKSVIDQSIDESKVLTSGTVAAVSKDEVRFKTGEFFEPNTPHFWAMLFELPCQPGTFVLQLVPRDRTDTGDWDPVAERDSTFFAPGGYHYVISEATATLTPISVDPAAPSGLAGNELLCVGNLNAEVASTIRGNQLVLANLLREAFLPLTSVGASEQFKLDKGGLLMEIVSGAIDGRPQRHANAKEAEAAMAEAGIASGQLSLKRSLIRSIEERRSAIIAAVAKSAERIAREATLDCSNRVVWPRRLEPTPEGVIDARDFGLTFVVSGKNDIDDSLSGLFEVSTDGSPPESTFAITQQKDVGNGSWPAPGCARRVHLFNPPSRFFDRANLDFAHQRILHDQRGVQLDWDLEAGWAESTSVWNDPEFHLKAYRLKRVFLVDGAVSLCIPPFETTFKAAAPLKPVVDEANLNWARMRPLAQYVDGFDDLPQALRVALTGTQPGDKAWEAWRTLLEQLGAKADDPIATAYTVVPVDVAGREGQLQSFECTLKVPTPAVRPIASAELFVEYDTLPGTASTEVKPKLALRLDDRADVSSRNAEPMLASDRTKYVLRLRAEGAAAIGQYGSDAVIEALHRPPAATFESKSDSDSDVVLILQFGKNRVGSDYAKRWGALPLPILDEAPPDASQPWLKCEHLEKLQTIGQRDDKNDALKPTRVALRRVEHNAEQGKPQGLAASPWMIPELHLRIRRPGDATLGYATPAAIDTCVETFEQPTVTGFLPLPFEDLDGSAGRLLIDQPAADSSLATLLGNEPRGSLRTLRDGSRRVATRLRWNGRPSSAETGKDEVEDGLVANTSPSMIAGYDVFESDLTASISMRDVVTTARHMARVMALDPRLANSEPATIDDYGAVEAYYPSETLRLEQAKSNSAARRRAWYSTAESLCIWPQPGIRRSLGLSMVDGDFSALFAYGPLERVAVRFDEPSQARLAQVLAPLTGTTQWFKAPENFVWNPPSETQPEGFFDKSGGIYPADLRKLLHGLYLTAPEPTIGTFMKHRQDLRGLTLNITAGDLEPESVRKASLTIDLDQGLHPVLADLVDALRWDTTHENAPFRRYEPVIDPAPQTDAKTLSGLLDQRPEQRDPYGWAVLRTLGLAVGLRLHDNMTGDFLPPRKMLEQVNEAWRIILPRYELETATPFTDLLTRAGGLYRLASFDGADPANASPQVLLDNDLAPLVQLSLRPTAEGLLNKPATGAHYFLARIEKSASADLRPVTWAVCPIAIEGLPDVLVEVLDVSNPYANPPVVALSATPPSATVQRLAGKERLIVTSAQFPEGSGGYRARQTQLLLRVTTTRDFKDSDDARIAHVKSWLSCRHGDSPLRIDLTVVQAPAALHGIDPTEAFERFPALPLSALDELLRAKEASESPAAVQFKRVQTYVQARFGSEAAQELAFKKPISQVDDEIPALIQKWPALLRRFLDHGTACLPRQNQDGTQAVRFSLAQEPRPQPMRLARRDDDTFEMVLVHDDRLARRRRYLVRPYGRYENIATGWNAAPDDGASKPAPLPWLTRRRLDDSIVPDGADDEKPVARLPQLKLERLDEFSLDIAVPRSEPLAPPVVLSAHRLDVGTGTDKQPGTQIEFVIARHAEQIASESNITVADSLQFEHVAIGFYRELRDRAWVMGLGGQALTELLPMIESPKPLKPAALSFKSSTFGETGNGSTLPERIVDGWRGITAVRTQDVPHLYKVHAAVFAAAGVVVSEPVVATVPEGHYALAWPWGTTANVAKPSWSVVIGDAGEAKVSISIPLVRYLDGMSDDERQRWFDGAPLADRGVYLAPDPGIAYELATVAGRDCDCPREVERMLQAQFNGATSIYTPSCPGAHFPLANGGQNNLPPQFGADNCWHLTDTLLPPPDVSPPLPTWEQRIEPFLQTATNVTDVAPENWTAFSAFMPWRQDAQIVITRPDDPFDAQGYRQIAKSTRFIADELQVIVNQLGGNSLDVAAMLSETINRLNGYGDLGNAAGFDGLVRWKNITGKTDRTATIPIRRYAGLALPANQPRVEISAGSTWRLERPAKVYAASRIPAMQALRNAMTNESAQAFANRLALALWEEDHGQRIADDQKPSGGFAAVVGVIADELGAAVIDVANSFNDQPTPGLEFLATIYVDLSRSDASVKQDALIGLIQLLSDTEIYTGAPGLGFAAAIVSLRPIEFGTARRASFVVPWVKRDEVREKVRALTTSTDCTVSHHPSALMLRRPPSDGDLHAALSNAPTDSTVRTFILDLATTQIFGRGRRPWLRATKGLLPSKDIEFERSTA